VLVFGDVLHVGGNEASNASLSRIIGHTVYVHRIWPFSDFPANSSVSTP
jgi:hypothetical protein